jgi:hypothetical protein
MRLNMSGWLAPNETREQEENKLQGRNAASVSLGTNNVYTYIVDIGQNSMPLPFFGESQPSDRLMLLYST